MYYKKITKRTINTIMGFLYEKKAHNIIGIDLRKVTDIADFFIICTAESDIHSKALCDNLEEFLEEKGLRPHHIEGRERAHWILMDYLDFVVHIFLPEERAFYSLERLWGDAPTWGMKDEAED